MTSTNKPKLHYVWVILFVSNLVVVGALGLARFSYSLLLPPMQAGLDMDNTQAGALATADTVGYLALSLIGGALASRYSPRAVVTAGLVLTGTGMLLTGAAQGVFMAVLGRAITGVGSGASNVPVMGLLLAWFSRNRRGAASGIAVAGASIAIIAVSPLVPRMVEAYPDNGWRMSWYLFGGVTLGLAVLAAMLLRNRPEEMGLAPWGDAAASVGPSRPQGALQWGQVYQSPAVWHLGGVYIAFGFSYIIYLTFFNKRLLSEGGYSPLEAGTLFMVFGWFSLFCGLIWGAVSDAIGRKQALVLVYLVHAAAFTLFGLATTKAGFVLSAALFGLTAWSIPAIMTAFCGDVLGSRMAPAALGFITLFFGIGSAAGPSIAGAIADSNGSFVPVYLLAGGVALVGAVGALLLRPVSTILPATNLNPEKG
ncbi:MAG TPA: MFS transporter [Anaerolineales bacterium]|nr:MFS transporter [Anaerolineales bacterium]